MICIDAATELELLDELEDDDELDELLEDDAPGSVALNSTPHRQYWF